MGIQRIHSYDYSQDHESSSHNIWHYFLFHPKQQQQYHRYRHHFVEINLLEPILYNPGPVDWNERRISKFNQIFIKVYPLVDGRQVNQSFEGNKSN